MFLPWSGVDGVVGWAGDADGTLATGESRAAAEDGVATAMMPTAASGDGTPDELGVATGGLDGVSFS